MAFFLVYLYINVIIVITMTAIAQATRRLNSGRLLRENIIYYRKDGHKPLSLSKA